MNPDDISRLAEIEKNKKLKNSKSKPFNPFDFMEFTETRKWIKNNLALSEMFYSYITVLVLSTILFAFFFLQNHDKWAYFGFIISCVFLFVSLIAGLIYGYSKKKKH